MIKIWFHICFVMNNYLQLVNIARKAVWPWWGVEEIDIDILKHDQIISSNSNQWFIIINVFLLIWQKKGGPGWRKVNLITVTRRPLHPSIATGFYCLTTSPGFLPALCEKWSGFFYVHRVWLSYTHLFYICVVRIIIYINYKGSMNMTGSARDDITY